MDLITEENAAKKFCFLPDGSDGKYKCYGSQCMAWRWHGTFAKQSPLSQAPPQEYGHCVLLR
jgi:hypothetical protein